MKIHPKPHGATSNHRGSFRLASAFILAATILAFALFSLAAFPGMTQAARPSALLLQPADPTQALPTSESDVTNQQGQTQEDQPLNGGSTDNNSNSGVTNNSNNNTQNPPADDPQGSTQGGNVAGNTGGADSPGGGFPWWIPVILVLLIAVSLPFLRRRPINEPATTNPAPDLERRDQR